ncbi:MAG: hypothetical protein KDB08_02030 [Microthrixaceae bacterium]|nr:hypothetical protein [Microthrixaceae bacterium]
MTLHDLVRALFRWWPITLLGIIASLGLALLSTRTEPVYLARTEVVLLAPSSARYPNELVTRTESLIITAGIVATRINGIDSPRPQFGNSLVNPVGAPDTGEHTWIGLLDTGNQWVSNFDDQVLLVDAIGETPELVEERIDAAFDLISSELLAAQNEFGVDAGNRITARMSPVAPVVHKVGGSKVRAAGMTLGLGGFATAVVIVVLEVRRRSERTTVPG